MKACGSGRSSIEEAEDAPCCRDEDCGVVDVAEDVQRNELVIPGNEVASDVSDHIDAGRGCPRGRVQTGPAQTQRFGLPPGGANQRTYPN